MRRVSEQDNGKTLDIVVGDTVEIVLPENPTAGYRWTLEAPDAAVCAVTADERHAAPAHVPGKPGSHVWRLKAAGAGTCRIVIAYRRGWETGQPPVRTFAITLHVRA